MQNDHYESWLAKQSAMGRRVPDTTAPYYAPSGTGKTVIALAHPGQDAIEHASIHPTGCPHNDN